MRYLPDTGAMTNPAEVVQELERSGYAVIPNRMDDKDLAAAREELSALVATADWGSGFDGTRTKRVWAVLAKTRCMDRAALDPLVLDVVEQMIGPGAQFSLTYATQVHPGQSAQALHYEQGIYPLPRDRDVMLTAIWALDDFTASNGATLVVPGSHQPATAKPEPGRAMPAEMPAGSLLLFCGRLYHGAGANTSTQPRLGVVIDYQQPWLRPCEAHTLSTDPAQVRKLPQRLQELLGYNQPSPYLGFINGQHPRQWLMNDHHSSRP
jgi:ectoine hydroxylase-related dioxygenase (phytanoyl-CoA dioxygenase family)